MFAKSLFAALALAAYSVAIHAAEPKIRLSEIVSTSTQRDLKHASTAFRDDGVFERSYGYQLQQIVLNSKSGASNLFLVPAANIDDAINASREVLLGGAVVSPPGTVNNPKPLRGGIWLVAYLGVGHSSPPAYVIKAVSVNGPRIRIAYHVPRPTTATRDIHPYYCWVPLGKLSDGLYKLELYDTDLKEITLVRLVQVKSSD
jgi:hypothetical protein